MTEKKVILSETVRQDIGAISDFIISVSRPEHAEQYTQQLLDELADLSYFATIRPECQWKLPKRYHSQAKTLPIRNQKPIKDSTLTLFWYVIASAAKQSNLNCRVKPYLD